MIVEYQRVIFLYALSKKLPFTPISKHGPTGESMSLSLKTLSSCPKKSRIFRFQMTFQIEDRRKRKTKLGNGLWENVC